MMKPNRDIRIIDGGIGTEIQRQGVAPDPYYWTAMAHMDSPELICGIYRQYLEAGADVISTNSFMAGKHILAAGGVEEFEAVNRESVRIAQQARQHSERTDVVIAGTLSPLPPLNQADDLPRGAIIDANFRTQAQLLADAGCDLLMAEMLIDSQTSASLLEACCQTGLPVWAGMSASLDVNDNLIAFRSEGNHKYLSDESFDALVNTVCGYPIAAAGVMHTDWALLPRALDVVTGVWSGAKFAYAKTGSFSEQDWVYQDVIAPQDYASMASDWVSKYDLIAVGGCCGTGPEHVRQLHAMLKFE